jgi:transposase
LLQAIVHSAGIQDCDGGILLLATLFGQFPFLDTLFADSAYQGPIFANALVKILPDLETEIVRRSDHPKGFVRLPKRWIVERTIAWLNRCRRLAKDWENLNRNALAFLKLASIRCQERTVGARGCYREQEPRDLSYHLPRKPVPPRSRMAATEAALSALGCRIDPLADVVGTGLASMSLERMTAANRTIEVVRIKIADAGRQAIVEART